jgi:DNA-binding transcriptional LysR family regulator
MFSPLEGAGTMAIRTKNLNLIPILQALLKHASVARAAEEIGLSQPATSGSLARLRELLDDPLLVRVGRSMRLTPRAEKLQKRLDDVCGQIDLLFQPVTFDPSVARMSFTIAAPDYIAFLLTDKLLKRLATEAPEIELHFVDVPPGDVAEKMETGKMDLLVCGNFGHWPELNSEFLFTERYVIAAADGHPLLEREIIHIDDLKEFPNPAVNYSSSIATAESRRWQTGIRVVDLGSQISSMTQFNGILLATQPGMIARTPATLAWRLRDLLPLNLIELADKDSTFATSMFWTAATDEALEHLWLRSTIRDALTPFNEIGELARKVS